jgi:hypothetical protein
MHKCRHVFRDKTFRNKIGSGKRLGDYVINVHSKRECIIDKQHHLQAELRHYQVSVRCWLMASSTNYVITKFQFDVGSWPAVLISIVTHFLYDILSCQISDHACRSLSRSCSSFLSQSTLIAVYSADKRIHS